MPSLATKTNQQGMIPLHLASLKGHVETLRELLKAKLDDDGGAVNHQCLVKDEEGWTPMHCASQKGKIRVMEELIRECPQSLEQVTAKGETVLHIAVKANQFGAVKLLAESLRHHNLHTLLKAQDQKGKSAYQLAAAKKLQSQVLEALKEDDGGREECLISMMTEEKSESKSQKDAILVVATLIITLTYQALANPPSTLFKGGGSSTVDWACLIDKNLRSHGFINRLKECPARLALFIIFNTLIFFTSIYVVVATLRGKNVFSMRFLTLLLTLCYSSLLAFYYKAV